MNTSIHSSIFIQRMQTQRSGDIKSLSVCVMMIALVGFCIVFPHILGTHYVWFNEHLCFGHSYWSWCVQINGFLTGYGILFILFVTCYIFYKLLCDKNYYKVDRTSRCNV